MGILEAITAPLAEQVSQRGMGIVVAAGFAAFLTLAVILNVLSQLLFKNPNEPPVVFHWFPIIGSTVTYGIDPYKFFFDCRAKVGFPFPETWILDSEFWIWNWACADSCGTVRRYLYVCFAREENHGLFRSPGK